MQSVCDYGRVLRSRCSAGCWLHRGRVDNFDKYTRRHALVDLQAFPLLRMSQNCWTVEVPVYMHPRVAGFVCHYGKLLQCSFRHQSG